MFSKRDIEKNNIGAYELCPCGSGSKFKFCCYKKAREAKHKESFGSEYSEQRINHMARQAWEDADFKTCFGFNKDECSPVIKGAHSIQNNRFLNRISKDGHVYQIRGEFSLKEGPHAVFNKISKNKASTFFGFCDYHDTELFKPIELNEYSEEPLQNFLFAFRASALEFHRKQRLSIHYQESFKKFPASLLDTGTINMYRVNQLDLKDMAEDYNYFMEQYSKNEFDNLRTIYRTLDYEVDFTTSSSFSVEYDLNEKQINDIYFDKSEKRMPSIYVSVYPVQGKTIIILSYLLQDNNTYKDYFDQLESLPERKLIEHLNYIIIEYTENIFFSPNLIDNMTVNEKESLLRSFSSSANILEKLELTIEQKYYNFNIFNAKST